MNGLYNGLSGLSHRARIPNELNINIVRPSITNETFAFNAKCGIFQIDLISRDYRIVHHIYAHRFYNRAIINQVYIYRLNYEGNQITLYYIASLKSKIIKKIKKMVVLYKESGGFSLLIYIWNVIVHGSSLFYFSA